MAITKFQLENLCCGKCAAKIQKDIALLTGVSSVEVAADTGILVIESELSADDLIKPVTDIAQSHEDAIIVTPL